jgi:hypothetical protein
MSLGILSRYGKRIPAGPARGVRRWSSTALTLAIATLMVVGCGSSAGGSSPATGGNGAPGSSSGAGGQGGGTQSAGGPQVGGPSGNMCSVLSDSQVATAVGASLGAGAPQNDGQMCLWQDTNNGEASITTEGSSFADLCGVADASVLKVEGVGDGACYLLGGPLATMLTFEKGSQVYTVSVVLPNGTVEAIEAAEKTLAQEAVPKL